MFSDIFNLWNVIKCYQMSHFGDIVKTKVTLNVPLFEGYQMLPNVTKCYRMLVQYPLTLRIIGHDVADVAFMRIIPSR